MKWPSCKKKKDVEYQQFLTKKLPVFWIIGQHGVGKSTLAGLLAKSSKYQLIKTSALLVQETTSSSAEGKVIGQCMNMHKKVPDKIVISLLKSAIVGMRDSSTGYIIDGFPVTVTQARMFEKKICNVSIVVDLILTLDGFLARMLARNMQFDPNEMRLKFVKDLHLTKKIASMTKNKLIKIYSNYPPEDTCTHLVEDLEYFWGYKFLRLYVKNQ